MGLSPNHLPAAPAHTSNPLAALAHTAEDGNVFGAPLDGPVPRLVLALLQLLDTSHLKTRGLYRTVPAAAEYTALREEVLRKPDVSVCVCVGLCV